ncbi:NUDIX domain-containing protein [Patescibacteria group bacterium]
MFQETINLTDKNDKILGQVVRTDAHQQGLWHQRVTIFVFNSKNELLIQKRASNMSWPNLWCGSASGHVLAGETYKQAGKRELKEEIGIECELKYIGKIIEKFIAPSGETENEHLSFFICNSDGPFNVQQEELSEVKFESIENIEKMLAENPEQFTPGFKQEFEYYIKVIKLGNY